MEIIDRQKDESLDEYKIRLMRNREEYGLCWSELSEILNKEFGVNYSTDKYRKFWSPFKEGIEYANRERTQTPEQDELSSKKQELVKERMKLQDQKREVNNRLRIEARQEHIIDEVRKSIGNLPLIYFKDKKPSIEKKKCEAALLLGDLHKGLFASNYWNEFNNDTFSERLAYLRRTVVNYCRTHEVNTLHIFNLGDFVNGVIHVSTRILSTEHVIKQTMEVSEWLSYFFYNLLEDGLKLNLYFIRGNHDRITPNKSDEVAEESFADIIQWYIKARLENVQGIDFVENTVDDELSIANICGSTCFAVHGHKDKPSDVIQNLSLMTKKVPDYVFMGHYHHSEENEINGVELVINGSFSGVDAYAKDIRKTSKPSQKLMIFQENLGRICTYNIRLDKLNYME